MEKLINTMNYDDFLANKIMSIKDAGIDINPSSLNNQLFPFQKAIVQWSLKRGRSAIFASCGLGKTPMQLEWARIVTKKTKQPVLILAPLAVNKQTKHEGDKFGIEVNLCRDQRDVQPGINIANYEILEKFIPHKFSGIVLDESSILKNLTGKMRNLLISVFSNTPYKLCCSATPAPNDHGELGNHSEFLNQLSNAQMLAQFFVNDGSKTGVWRLKKHAVQHFWQWVSSWAVCINKPSDHGFDDDGFILPELIWHQHIVRVDSIDDFFQGNLFKNPNLSAMNLHKEMRQTVTHRVDKAKEIIGDSKDYWLIWCNTNYEADALRKAFPQATEVRGSESIHDKENKLESFSNGRTQIMITKPSIAGFGLNWQHCHKMIFIGMSYSFEQSYQAVRRTWRFGQEHAVDVHCIMAETEVEVFNAVERKALQHQEMEGKMISMVNKISAKHENPLRPVKSGNKYSGNNWDIIEGDSVQEIKSISDESVHFSIFSPPFANIFVYSSFIEDMGNCKSFQEFFAHFDFMIPELLRITKPGRLCAVHCSVLPTFKWKDGQIGLYDFRGDLIKAFIKFGWIYHSEVCIWKCPVVEMTRTKAKGLLYKQLKKDSAAVRQGIPDYLLIFSKPGENKEPITHSENDFPLEIWQRYASPVWTDIQQTNVLNVREARGKEDERHICPLQLDVISRAVELWTNPGDLVFSPFAGIGSEGYQAIKMGRKFLGIELKPEYVKVACDNLRKVESQKMLFTEDV